MTAIYMAMFSISPSRWPYLCHAPKGLPRRSPDHLTGLVRDVERGQRVDLTRRGKRVVVLLSAEEYERLMGKRASPARTLRTKSGTRG